MIDLVSLLRRSLDKKGKARPNDEDEAAAEQPEARRGAQVRLPAPGKKAPGQRKRA